MEKKYLDPKTYTSYAENWHLIVTMQIIIEHGHALLQFDIDLCQNLIQKTWPLFALDKWKTLIEWDMVACTPPHLS